MTSKQRLCAVLRQHWLTGTTCNKERGTNRATCYCSVWLGAERGSPVAAVEDWINHILVRLTVETITNPLPAETRAATSGSERSEIEGAGRPEPSDETTTDGYSHTASGKTDGHSQQGEATGGPAYAIKEGNPSILGPCVDKYGHRPDEPLHLPVKDGIGKYCVRCGTRLSENGSSQHTVTES